MLSIPDTLHAIKWSDPLLVQGWLSSLQFTSRTDEDLNSFGTWRDISNRVGNQSLLGQKGQINFKKEASAKSFLILARHFAMRAQGGKINDLNCDQLKVNASEAHPPG